MPTGDLGFNDKQGSVITSAKSAGLLINGSTGSVFGYYAFDKGLCLKANLNKSAITED